MWMAKASNFLYPGDSPRSISFIPDVASKLKNKERLSNNVIKEIILLKPFTNVIILFDGRPLKW